MYVTRAVHEVAEQYNRLLLMCMGVGHAGTVVDRDIVHPSEHSFYLMSHSGLLGTSRPTHYHVIFDNAPMGPDELQVCKGLAEWKCASLPRSYHGW